MGIAYALGAENKKKLDRKITICEFQYACKILSHSTSTTLNMGEFILLSFMRLGHIDKHQIDVIRAKFLELDVDGKGELSQSDLQRLGAMVLDKHTAQRMASNSLDSQDLSIQQWLTSRSSSSSHLVDHTSPHLADDSLFSLCAVGDSMLNTTSPEATTTMEVGNLKQKCDILYGLEAHLNEAVSAGFLLSDLNETEDCHENNQNVSREEIIDSFQDI